MTEAPTHEQLAALKQQVSAAVRERLDIEAQLSDPDALRSATQRAFRDRDAVTNPALEDLSPQVAAEITRLREEWSTLDRLLWNLDRMAAVIDAAPAEIRSQRDSLIAAVPEARAARERVAADLAAAGLEHAIPASRDGNV